MATTSLQTITAAFTGDLENTYQVQSSANGASPASTDLVTLASGANTITKPAGGSTVVGCIIVPPTGNTAQITLKGVSGDTGILLHLTNPSLVSLAAGVSTFVLNAASSIVGVRLTWV